MLTNRVSIRMLPGFTRLLALLIIVLAAGFFLTGCPEGLGNAGTAACLECHNGQIASAQPAFKNSPHYKTGCEGCHGSGQNHIRSLGVEDLPVKVESKASILALCKECHENETTAYESGPHASQAENACISCHDVHDTAQVKPGRCLECHTINSSQPLHVKHVEKKDCTECHGPHAPLPAPIGGCTPCHVSESKDLASDEHQSNSCTACHAFGGPTLLPSANICLKCHKELPGGELHGTHAADLAIECTKCHGPHAPTKNLGGTCAVCHTAEVQKLASGDHSPNTCVNCHDFQASMPPPSIFCTQCHGAPTNNLLHVEHAATQNLACTLCHAPHAPRENLGTNCATCHTTEAQALASGGHRAKACVDCHKFLAATPPSADLCTQCHGAPLDIRHNTHVVEQVIPCRTCHLSPHAPLDNIFSVCITCHQEKTAGM